jgi:hypothetical protein
VHCARFRRAVVLKDRALGVFVSEVSSVFDRIRPRIADRLVQASGSAPECFGTRIHSLAGDARALRGVLAASVRASEAEAADPRLTGRTASDAAPGDPVLPAGIRH